MAKSFGLKAMVELTAKMDREDDQAMPPLATVEPVMVLDMPIVDEPVPKEPVQLDLTPDELMHEESVKKRQV